MKYFMYVQYQFQFFLLGRIIAHLALRCNPLLSAYNAFVFYWPDTLNLEQNKFEACISGVVCEIQYTTLNIIYTNTINSYNVQK